MQGVDVSCLERSVLPVVTERNDLALARIKFLEQFGEKDVGSRCTADGADLKELVVFTAGAVLHVNPGSAGPRRFRLPISAGELLVDGANVSARIIEF